MTQAAPHAPSSPAPHRGAFFSPDALAFLRDLDKHNERDWFEAHKDRYLASLRDPYLQFLTELAPRLQKVSAHFTVNPAPTGGSLARIHRDMRFVRDGLPYKTALSAHFAHDKAKPGAEPSFYLSLSPGKSFVAGGLRTPDGEARKKVQRAIDRDEPRWRRLSKNLEITGLVARAHFADGDVTSVHFLSDVTAQLKKLAPFVAFLTEAVGLKM
jgi:uncharacterized protein (TIGR02453 family)